jgi:hypothetical protein
MGVGVARTFFFVARRRQAKRATVTVHAVAGWLSKSDALWRRLPVFHFKSEV